LPRERARFARAFVRFRRNKIGSSAAACAVPPLRSGSPDSRSADRRRTAVLDDEDVSEEVLMSMMQSIGVASDRVMAALVSGLEIEFGRGAGEALAHRFLEAEEVDFHWDARVQERWIGTYESMDDEDPELDRVKIFGSLDGEMVRRGDDRRWRWQCAWHDGQADIRTRTRGARGIRAGVIIAQFGGAALVEERRSSFCLGSSGCTPRG
jgi:hypothetical protein